MNDNMINKINNLCDSINNIPPYIRKNKYFKYVIGNTIDINKIFYLHDKINIAEIYYFMVKDKYIIKKYIDDLFSYLKYYSNDVIVMYNDVYKINEKYIYLNKLVIYVYGENNKILNYKYDDRKNIVIYVCVVLFYVIIWILHENKYFEVLT